MSLEAQVGAMTGVAAPPRSNGELLFDEPWQARVFGITLGLVQERGLAWEEFRTRLIDEIARSEKRQRRAAGDSNGYYACWLVALERMVVDLGLAAEAELEAEIYHVASTDAHDQLHDHRVP